MKILYFYQKKINHYSTISMLPENGDGIIENLTDSEGNKCTRADVVVKKNKKGNYEYETCLVCGDYYTDSKICRGEYDDWNGSEGESDKTAPDVTDIYVNQKTTNSITVNATCFDGESKISKYIYYMNDENGLIERKESEFASYKFDNLTVNKKYNFKVECINEAGLKRESKDIDVSTPKFTNPSIKLVQTSDGFPIEGFDYSPKRDAQITYNDYNIEENDVQYFLRSTVKVETNVDVYKCTGDLNNLDQNSCLNEPSKTMLPNVWYKTNDDIATSTFAADTENGNHILYAQIGDTVNLSGIFNYEITKIDVTPPTIRALVAPLALGKDPYNFLKNLTYTFGYSDGNVSCDIPFSKGTGTYPITCTATGNNGLSEEVYFWVKHSYSPSWTTIKCNEHDCCWNCHEETSCHCNGGWSCDGLDYCWGYCIGGQTCTTGMSCDCGTCWDSCPHPVCSQPSSRYNGSSGLCEYY